MAFLDVINNYAQGGSGTLNTGNGESVNYTVTSGVQTSPNNGNNQGFPNTDRGARIEQDGDPELEITFDAPVSGLSLTFDRSNIDETYFVKINGEIVDLNELISDGGVLIGEERFTGTFSTVIADDPNQPPGTHAITTDGGMTSTGNFNNGSLGSITIFGKVDTIGVVGDGTPGGGFDIIEIGIDDLAFDVVCFAAGTQIATQNGCVDVATLRAGDHVVTGRGSVATIVHTQHRHFARTALLHETRLRPVRIATGALGNGLPIQDLLVSRQHRILVSSRIAARLTRHTDVLIPAIKLVGLPGITIDRQIASVDYHHILLTNHDIILANGAPAETLFSGPVALRALEEEPSEMTGETLAMFDTAPMAPACHMPDAKMCKKIVAAHLKHDRPLLEEWTAAHA